MEKHKSLKAQKMKEHKIESIQRPSHIELPQYSKHTTSLCRETYLFRFRSISVNAQHLLIAYVRFLEIFNSDLSGGLHHKRLHRRVPRQCHSCLA